MTVVVIRQLFYLFIQILKQKNKGEISKIKYIVSRGKSEILCEIKKQPESCFYLVLNFNEAARPARNKIIPVI